MSTFSKQTLRIRPTYAEINCKNLSYNYNIIKSLINKKTKILSVVKANAYGHGSIEIAKILQKKGCDYFGVSSIEEGIELRTSGIKCSILVLSSIFPYSSFEFIYKYKLIPTISSLTLAKKFSAFLKKKKSKFPVHIKIDTGMGRIGINIKRAKDTVRKIALLPNIIPEGVYTHLACADENKDYTYMQLNNFLKLKKELSDLKIKYFHAANTAALINYPGSHFDMIRPGLALYGLVSRRMSLRFKPVMSLKSKIVFLKTVPKGFNISYGLKYTTYRKSIIATVPIGYADGYNRLLSNVVDGFIRNKRVSQVGTICMDMCMFDVTGIQGIDVGDEVILIGATLKDEITAEDFANYIGTNTYEVVCGISKRVPRVYK